ncbi:MAG TPA: DUF1501 domain-containing protein [Planctomycetota bacterium]|nr:DUF1501 domain-containing protein [Planctomycetota bacterium]
MKAPAHITRRDFLSSGAAFVAASHLKCGLPLTTDGFITFINLAGGNDALNTLIPTHLQAYAQQRPAIAIPPTAGLPLDTGPYANSDYVLHPAMPALANLYRAGYVAFVRMVGYPGANMSHFASEDVWSRGGVAPTQPDSGWIARYKDLYAPAAISVVALGLSQRLDFRGGTTPSTFSVIPPDPSTLPPYTFTGDIPFRANDRLRFELAEQVALRARAAGLPERARVAQLAMYEQFRELRASLPPIPPEYPSSNFGYVLGSSAGMLREALPVKMFYARGVASDFDTHYDQGGVTGAHATALFEVDAALAAYAADLQQMGVWNRAVIVLFSEFGRRNAAPSNGTDHGTGGLMILVGGAVRGGMFGPELTEEAVNAFTMPMQVDFRTVYEELLLRHLEVDPVPVFTETYTRQPPLGLVL